MYAKFRIRINATTRASLLAVRLCWRPSIQPVNSATFKRVSTKRADISHKLPLWSRQYAKRAARYGWLLAFRYSAGARIYAI